MPHRRSRKIVRLRGRRLHLPIATAARPRRHKAINRRFGLYHLKKGPAVWTWLLLRNLNALTARILSSQLRSHHRVVCKLRMVNCPECGAEMLQGSIKGHLEEVCEVRKNNSTLVPDLECPACRGEYRPSYMRTHRKICKASSSRPPDAVPQIQQYHSPKTAPFEIVQPTVSNAPSLRATSRPISAGRVVGHSSELYGNNAFCSDCLDRPEQYRKSAAHKVQIEWPFIGSTTTSLLCEEHFNGVLGLFPEQLPNQVPSSEKRDYSKGVPSEPSSFPRAPKRRRAATQSSSTTPEHFQIQTKYQAGQRSPQTIPQQPQTQVSPSRKGDPSAIPSTSLSTSRSPSTHSSNPGVAARRPSNAAPQNQNQKNQIPFVQRSGSQSPSKYMTPINKDK